MITPSIYRFEEVGSTNDIALGMAKHGASEGTVILARCQTKGRGRRGRVWVAKPDESIIMSVVLRPNTPPGRHSELALMAGVAVAECLEQKCNLCPSLKWPNDVFVGDRKITGILVESEPRAAIVGIGLNVLQSSFPPELSDTATSVLIEHGACAEIETLTTAILEHLFSTYTLGFEEIRTRWQKYMWGLGSHVAVETENTVLSGTIIGIDYDGALLIDHCGITRRVIAADAIHLQHK